jgi:1,4-dihydroxy-2-naphthoyl-CoA hydrolase
LEETPVRHEPGVASFAAAYPHKDRSMAAWEPAPFVKLLGVKIISRTAQRSEAELVIRDELCNRRNVMHGGAIMGWADTMGGMTTLAALPDGHRTATIESKTNFFAPIPKGDTARAVTMPLHIGRTTIVMQTNITRGDGKLAAIITQTQIVLPLKEPPE